MITHSETLILLCNIVQLCFKYKDIKSRKRETSKQKTLVRIYLTESNAEIVENACMRLAMTALLDVTKSRHSLDVHVQVMADYSFKYLWRKYHKTMERGELDATHYFKHIASMCR